MTREEKKVIIETLTEHLKTHPHFYVVDIEGLNAADTSDLRRKCSEHSVRLMMVKNTLFRRALADSGREVPDEVVDSLKGPSAIFFAEVANAPAKIIKEFRAKSEKPVLKAAWAEESSYVGDEHLAALATLKSRDELIGDILALLQSPAKNVISALQSGGRLLSGVVKTLSER